MHATVGVMATYTQTECCVYAVICAEYGITDSCSCYLFSAQISRSKREGSQ